MIEKTESICLNRLDDKCRLFDVYKFDCKGSLTLRGCEIGLRYRK